MIKYWYSDDFVTHAKPYQTGNIPHTQFAHDVGSVVVNRARANEKLLGYPAV